MTCGQDYSSYTMGCRCPACRAAKAAYMRLTRAAYAAARRRATRAGQRNIVPDIKHGLSGFQNYSCRCATCCETARVKRLDQRQRQTHRPRGAA